jgi:hypothetical protein
VHVADVGQAAGEQVGVGGAAEPAGEVVQVRPHQLGGEHAVAGAPLRERLRDRVAAVRLARVGRREQDEELRVVHALEVLSRLPWEPRSRQPLEELPGVAGNPSAVQQRAQQRAAAPGRRADEEGLRNLSHRNDRE